MFVSYFGQDEMVVNKHLMLQFLECHVADTAPGPHRRPLSPTLAAQPVPTLHTVSF